ncbi:MAG TPA: DUF389 domain-containing protein [Anaerolineales bacterium]
MTTPDPSFPSPDPTNPVPGSNTTRQGLTRSRRRRRGQPTIPSDAEGRTALLASLARRAYPTYELFVYALICGAILGLGYVLDSQAVLLFGILVAPLLSPWIGLLLATVTGSARFFLNSLMALLLSALLVFAIGALAGLAARPFMPRTFNEAFLHSRLWWPDLIVLALGAVILTISFVRSEAKPFLPSVMLAYGLFMPLSAGGFGLGSGLGNVWPHGLLVFLAYFAWAGMFGLLTLMALRFLPSNLKGFLMSAALAIVLVAALLILMGGSGWAPSFAMQPPIPTSTPPASPTVNPNLPPILAANTATPVVDTTTPSATVPPTPVPLTLQVTLPPTASPTITLTIEPTPVYARIKVGSGGGAVLRSTPGGKGITVLDNFSIVQVLPDTQDVSGTTWAHVIANVGGNRMDGWVVQLYLDVATPVPNWQPSATPATSATP